MTCIPYLELKKWPPWCSASDCEIVQPMANLWGWFFSWWIYLFEWVSETSKKKVRENTLNILLWLLQKEGQVQPTESWKYLHQHPVQSLPQQTAHGDPVLYPCSSNKSQFLWAKWPNHPIIHLEVSGGWASREVKKHELFSGQGYPQIYGKDGWMWCSSPNQVRLCCELQLKLLLEQFFLDQQAGWSELEVNMIR